MCFSFWRGVPLFCGFKGTPKDNHIFLGSHPKRESQVVLSKLAFDSPVAPKGREDAHGEGDDQGGEGEAEERDGNEGRNAKMLGQPTRRVRNLGSREHHLSI